jgi:hypothetical protein
MPDSLHNALTNDEVSVGVESCFFKISLPMCALFIHTDNLLYESLSTDVGFEVFTAVVLKILFQQMINK